jgi:hypothetical protein
LGDALGFVGWRHADGVRHTMATGWRAWGWEVRRGPRVTSCEAVELELKSANVTCIASSEVRAMRRTFRRTSGRFRAPSQRVQAERFGLFGGEDEGHLRGALARFAAHRDLRAAVWMIPNLALLLGHGFRGTTVEASETLFPRDTPQPAVL